MITVKNERVQSVNEQTIPADGKIKNINRKNSSDTF
jgi:hypothetical protein